MSIVLSDSGPIIALAKINRLQLLRDLWGTVHITNEVYQEAVVLGQAQGAPDALTIRLFWQRHKLPVVAVSDDVLAAYMPATILDPGEHSTFAHALTLKEVLVLVDDEDARVEARRLGLPIRGTLGVLVEAHRRALLALPEVELLINELGVRPDIWISADLCTRIIESIRSTLGQSA